MTTEKTKPAKVMKFQDGTFEITEGQKVVVTNVNDRGRAPRECVVHKIGNKLVEVYDSSNKYKVATFYLEGGEKSEYSHNSLYSSLEGHAKYVARSKKIQAINYAMSSHYSKINNLTDEQMQQLIDLLGIQKQVDEQLNK